MLLTKSKFVTIAKGKLCYPNNITEPFKKEGEVSDEYTDITSISNWNLFGHKLYKNNYISFRDMLITDFESSWGSLTDDDKKILIKNYIWPSTITLGELDSLYSQEERESMFKKMVAGLKLEGNLLLEKSGTPTKYFYLAVSEENTPMLVEIKTDVPILG